MSSAAWRSPWSQFRNRLPSFSQVYSAFGTLYRLLAFHIHNRTGGRELQPNSPLDSQLSTCSGESRIYRGGRQFVRGRQFGLGGGGAARSDGTAACGRKWDNIITLDEVKLHCLISIICFYYSESCSK